MNGARISLFVATGLAIWLASGQAWGHSFPPVRTVVVQVEKCEVALLVGFRPATGETTDRLLSRVASQPKSHALEAMRDVLSAAALAPLTVLVDGKPLVPTAVRAKFGVEPGGERPMVVVLVTFALLPGKTLAIRSTDTRTTRISWTDQDSGRVEIVNAPAQGHLYAGVASFLLSLSASTGDSPCASSNQTSRPSRSPPSLHSAPSSLSAP